MAQGEGPKSEALQESLESVFDLIPDWEVRGQPPYSPQCYPVENSWDEIREKWFPNLVSKSMQAVEDTLEKALLALENDNERTQSIAGFEWIVSILLNAT